MNDNIIDFINSYIDDIDDEEWGAIFDSIYEELDVDDAEECVNMLLETFDRDEIESELMSKFWEKFDEITELSRFKDIEVNKILEKYNNYYGLSFSDARSLLIENPDIDWDTSTGGYILRAEVR